MQVELFPGEILHQSDWCYTV